MLGLITASFGIRLFVALVFIFAAQHKLRNRLDFEGIITQYRLTRASASPLLSWLIPAIELICAATLVLAPALGALCAAHLLTGYASAIFINLLRGRHHIDCGCGGEATPLSPGLIGRNLLMVLALVGVVFVENSPLAQATAIGAGSFTSSLLASGFAAGLGALYISFNQLQTNTGIYRRLWLGERVG